MKLGGISVLVLLLVVTVAWIGFTVYFENTSLDIDPNATSYMQYINPTFDTKGIEEVSKRVEESLIVSPSEFKALSGISEK